MSKTSPSGDSGDELLFPQPPQTTSECRTSRQSDNRSVLHKMGEAIREVHAEADEESVTSAEALGAFRDSVRAFASVYRKEKGVRTDIQRFLDNVWRTWQRLVSASELSNKRQRSLPELAVYAVLLSACRVDSANCEGTLLRIEKASADFETLFGINVGIHKTHAIMKALQHSDAPFTNSFKVYQAAMETFDGLWNLYRSKAPLRKSSRQNFWNHAPSSITYDLLVNAYALENGPGAAWEWLQSNKVNWMVAQERESSGSPAQSTFAMAPYSLTRRLYNFLVAAHISPGGRRLRGAQTIAAQSETPDVEGALRVLDHMITEDKMYPNVVSYTLIIHGYVKRGEIEKALRCFADMKENGITPNRVTYETLIYGHLQCLKWNRDRRVISLGLNFGYEGADDFSDSMELSFSDAMESEEDLFLRMYEESKYQKDQWPLLDIPHQESADELSKRLDISMDFEDGSMRKEEMLQRNVECAANLFEEMLRCGHTPGVVLYDILMNAHIDRGEHQKSIDLFRRMIGAEPNVFNAKVVPDLRIYTTLLVALTASGDVEAAQYVVRLLQSRNLANPDVVMYTVLMNGYGKRGDVGEMKAVFAELLEKGLKPTVITYSTILYAHCRVGNMRAAEEVLSEIKAQGLKLNLIVYNTLIHGYGKAQDLAAATRTFNRMRKNRIKPTITTFNILMAAHIRCGDVRGTMRWFELLTSPAVAGGSRTAERTTMTAATAASQSRRPKPRMPAIRPNLITYNLLVWANAKNRNALRAAETIATMVARRFKPDVATYAPIVRMHARQGDYAAALEVARAVGGAARAEALAEAADVGGDGAAGCGAAAALASASVSVSAAGVSLRDVAAGRVPVGPLHLRGTKAGGVVSYDPMVPYNIMMSAMLRNRDYETAEGVFEWADATTRERRDANKAAEEEGAGEGSEQDGGVGGLRLSPQPDLHSFDMIVRMHGAMGQSAKSRHWVEEAIRRGVKPDVRIFNSLMTACLACKDYDGAEDAYWMMKREGLKPDMVSMALYFRVERERERLREEEEGGEAEEEEEGEVQPV